MGRQVGADADLLHQQEEGEDQARVGEPGPGEAALAPQGLPEGALRVDVDAGGLAGHAGALLAAIGGDRAAHRLGDARTGAHMGLTAHGPSQAGEHGLHRPHRADVLAPGLAAPGPAHQHCRRQGGQQQDRQTQGAAVNPQQPQAEPGDQQAPLQRQVVACQPGLRLHLHQLRLPLAAGAGALPAEGPGQLRHERKRTHAPPELMAEHPDQQHTHGHHRAPEQPVAGLTMQLTVRIDQQRAGGHQPLGQRQQWKQQGDDQQQPADQ